MLKKKNLWRGLTMVFALLLAVSMMAGNILELYRTSVDAFLGTRSTQTVTEQSDDESDAWTYKSEFTTAKEAYEGFKDFAIEASQETFALLKNENGALPRPRMPKSPCWASAAMLLFTATAAAACRTASPPCRSLTPLPSAASS